MPRKTPLPVAELQVGKRLDWVRHQRRLSRSDLAYFARVDEASITRAELGLAPLNYEVARRILEHLDVNPFWIATGQGAESPFIALPDSFEIGARRGAGFLEVFDLFLRPILARQFGPEAPGADFSAEELAGPFSEPFERVAAFKALSYWIGLALASMDRSQIQAFRERFKFFMRDCPSQPERDWKFRLKGTADIAGASGEYEAWARRLSSSKEFQKLLTNSSPSPTTPSMPTWAQLKTEVQRFTKERGAKAALARHCSVTPQAVASWLDDESETQPGAEAAFRLLEWAATEKAKRAAPAAPKPSKSAQSKPGKGKR